MTDDQQGFPAPIFVGGVGRSGTHPVGRLIAAHPRYHLIRTEARFHAVDAGLPGVLAGTVSPEAFLKRLRGQWWKRGFRQGQGLQRIVEEEDFETALRRFEADFTDDPWGAGGRLVSDLLDPAARRDGKPAWVEVTGQVVEAAPTLLRMFPRAKFINMVRDGRAVVAGIVRKADMTDDPIRALSKWEEMVRASDRAIRDLPGDAILTLQLDDLAARERERSYGRLVSFLEIEDDEPMRRYFDETISADAAKVGRWRERMPPPDTRRIDRRYRRLVRRLRREGIDWVPTPEPRRLRPRLGAARAVVAAGRRAPG